MGLADSPGQKTRPRARGGSSRPSTPTGPSASTKAMTAARWGRPPSRASRRRRAGLGAARLWVLAKIRLMCDFTVVSATNSRSAISVLDSPAAMSASTSASRSVSPSGSGPARVAVRDRAGRNRLRRHPPRGRLRDRLRARLPATGWPGHR